MRDDRVEETRHAWRKLKARLCILLNWLTNEKADPYNEDFKPSENAIFNTKASDLNTDIGKEI